MAPAVHGLDRLLVLHDVERTPQSGPADFQEIAQCSLRRQPVPPVTGGNLGAQNFRDLDGEGAFLRKGEHGGTWRWLRRRWMSEGARPAIVQPRW